MGSRIKESFVRRRIGRSGGGGGNELGELLSVLDVQLRLGHLHALDLVLDCTSANRTPVCIDNDRNVRTLRNHLADNGLQCLSLCRPDETILLRDASSHPSGRSQRFILGPLSRLLGTLLAPGSSL